MKTIAERKAESYWGMAFAGFVLGFALLLVALLQNPRPNVHIDKCPFDSAGNVIPDRSADGVLTVAADIYFVHRDGIEDSIVASCLGKGGCKGPAIEMRRHVGESAHVQYCGRTVTGVIASGIKIFEANPDTQATMDARASWEKRTAAFMGVAFVLFGALCFLKLRLIRREGSCTTS
ncbi:hypothetical protein [Paraburkholderia bryophila]|uniref:Uncharacterized protein n=1 Tax=Paraburkholderia bryophila TaxID=420952 RepID=A0A7Y9WDX3_9BURK|nr:hypothetical protein [Paraburkholderia bryophila]NYH18932.1 hypothetical protein [Paraburkholderia bryophila]